MHKARRKRERRIQDCYHRVSMRGRVPMQRTGGACFTSLCNGPCIDEIRSWNGWRNGRLEHRGDDPNSSLVNESHLCKPGARDWGRTMYIRRVSPAPWNTGTTCALMTIPQKSWPPCHGKQYRLNQVRLVKVTNSGNATEPKKIIVTATDHEPGMAGCTGGMQDTN